MKKSLLVVILTSMAAVLFMSCIHSSSNNLEYGYFKVEHAKDYKTNLCFANISHKGRESFSNIKCTKEVLNRLSRKRVVAYYSKVSRTNQCLAYRLSHDGFLIFSVVPCTKKVLNEIAWNKKPQ